MIENFETVKKQLSELAPVINGFKSEAVQLRIIELVLGAAQPAHRPTQDDTDARPIAHARGRKRRQANAAEASGDKPAGGGRKAAAGRGPVAQLNALAAGTFFNTARTITDIVKHCETNLAKRIKQSDISGKLGRMVRNGELTRTKNSDGQYEYQKA